MTADAAVENKGVSGPRPKPSPPLKKQTAAPAGTRNGGKTNKKASNLQSGHYLAGRIDAIANLLAPPFPCPLVIERLIELADAAFPDCDLESSFGSESFGHPGSDECEIDPDFEESLTFTDQRGTRSYAIYGVWAVDLEWEDEREPEEDCWVTDVHSDGGNGDVPTKEENFEIERERRAISERNRRITEIWNSAQDARNEAGLAPAPWSEENQARAEAGLPLLGYGEARQ